MDRLEGLLQELKQIVGEKNERLQQQQQQAALTMQGVRTPQKVPSVTMSVLLAKAVGMTLQKHPLINSAYDAQNGGGLK